MISYTMKKYIILAGIILAIIVVATVLLNLRTPKSPQPLDISSYEAAPAEPITQPSPIPEEDIKPVRALTARENEAIEVMRTEVTDAYVVEPDFELGYSDVLHKFILRKKNDNAASALQQYLTGRGAQALLSTPPSYKLIIYTEKPLLEAIPELESAYREQMLNNANERYDKKDSTQNGAF